MTCWSHPPPKGWCRGSEATRVWSISTDQLRVQGDDGRAVARMHLTLPSDGTSPVMDLFAQGEDLKVGSTHKYLPADKLGPKTLEWFDHALVDGRISTAEFTYKGPMRQFPFRKNEGTFLARAQSRECAVRLSGRLAAGARSGG